MDRPVQIRPSDPGVRFRVDPSGSSVESSGASAPGSRATTVEGGRPDTIFEDDEYANNADNEPGYRNSYYGDEETALITPIERQENDVFLISNRPSFTLSSNSHHVTVVPPTPTESSASAGHALDVIPPTVVQPRLPLIIPPVPRTPPPVPPGAATKPNPLHGSSQSVHGPRERVPRKAVTKDTDIHPKLQTNLPTAPRHADPRQLGQPQDIPHFPPPPAAVHFKQTLPPQTRPQADISVPLVSHAPRKPSVDEAHSKIKTTMAPTKGRSDTLAPILPSSSTSTSSASRAPSPAPTPAPTPTPGHAPRQPSLDSLKNAHERPMGPRRPSSPRHIARQISLDEEMGKFRPTVPPGESAYASPPPNPVAAAPALAAVRGVGIQHAGHDHHVYPKRGYSVEDIVDAMSVSTSMSMSNGSLSPAVPSEESMFLGSHPFSQAERIVRAQHDVHHHRKATSDDVRMMTRVEQGARPSHSASPAPAPHPHPHQHIHRQYSNDNAPGLALGPVNAHPYTYAHRPTLSPPPQAMHDRNSSLESLMSILPGDGRMLYPGPVRAAGYNIHLPPDATE
ncbi:hypothetical protein H0H92_006403 [Tricholoma furcatifolium]|nr:hypothetical protein H0H92_006403 [Tricholoma furcatifolium]